MCKNAAGFTHRMLVVYRAYLSKSRMNKIGFYIFSQYMSSRFVDIEMNDGRIVCMCVRACV